MDKVSARRIELVRFEQVKKFFGMTRALLGVTGEISPGRLTMIEGANGSGKSTLLRILGTIMRPTSGKVRYLPLDDPSEVKREVGWLSHEPLSYGDLSGRVNVELAAEAYGLDAPDAWRRVAERLEIGRFAERPLRTNSRGQRQRIGLARALVHRPSLLLLDEPTTGLDRAGVKRLLEVVAEEVEHGAAVVVVTHDAAPFEDLGPDRIRLERGKMVDVS